MDYKRRAKEMRRLYLDCGLTLQQVGLRFGVSRERVRQIIPDAPKLKRLTEERRAALLPGWEEMRVVRFWSKVDVKRGKETCWPWRGNTNPVTGYGHINFGNNGKNSSVAAHRVAYELVFGQAPQGKHICHTCDNSACCNPRHLVARSAAWNHKDAVKKGRKSEVGSFTAESRMKLTEQDVTEIKNKYSGPASCPILGKEYGVHSTYIYQIAKYDAR